MASNKIPPQRGLLAGLGSKIEAGLVALGADLGITQITPESFAAELSAFNDALRDYNSARSRRQAAYDEYHSAIDELTLWLGVARLILAGRFGNRWNTLWAQTGFVQPSTRVPRRLPDRIALAQNLAAFFEAHPDYEVSSMSVTAARGAALREAVLAAQEPLMTATVTLKEALALLNRTQQRLRHTMRYLVHILSGALDKNDPRWEGFGLDLPGMRQTPAAPAGLRAQLSDSSILLECEATPLATRYRWRRKVVGVDNKFELAASAREPMAVMAKLSPGMTVEFIVQAVNGELQSVASDSIFFTVPPLVTVEDVVRPEARTAASVQTPAPVASNGEAATVPVLTGR